MNQNSLDEYSLPGCEVRSHLLIRLFQMCGINSSCPQRCLYDMEMTSVSVRRDAKPPNENVIIRAIHVQAFWGLGLRCELRKADESL